MESLIRASAMWGFGDLVRELGADPERMQRRFGISPGAEHEDDALVSLQALARMGEACVAELDCPDFGLRLSSVQGLHILGPIAVIARNAETVQAGLAAIARYLYVHSPALKLAAEPDTEGSDVRFTYEITTLGLPEAAQIYEISMGNAVRIVRLLSGTASGPSAISFMHDQQGPDAAYAAELGCDVRFGQAWCGFEMPRELAARPIDRADPETRRIATTYLESTYLPSNATLTERVAELARRLLPTGHCSVDEIAEQLAVHRRTLQRRLAEEGASILELIEGERKNQAAKYIADPRLQLSQVASLLGYAEQSSFNRSFRQWFGTTPRDYRNHLQRSAAGN